MAILVRALPLAAALMLIGCEEMGDWGNSERYKEDFHGTFPLNTGGTVSLERHELHLLHLPISPDSASSLCASTLGGLAAALTGTSCNATSARTAFDSAMPPLVEQAAARGFFLSAGWQPGGAGCSSTYWIMLVELGVEGVTGSFDWAVRGSGATP